MSEKCNVETIRTLTAEMFEKKCAVFNPERMLMSDEEKKLYFQCLCLVLSGETSEITDEQHQYLLRLLKGAEMPDSLEAYFGTTKNLAEDSLQMLYPVLQKGKLRYYFLLEGILLAAMQNQNRIAYSFLAKVAEQMEISKSDAKYICSVAMSILKQDEAIFPKIWRGITKGLRECDFTPYVREYYGGLRTASYGGVDKLYIQTVGNKIPEDYWNFQKSMRV